MVVPGQLLLAASFCSCGSNRRVEWRCWQKSGSASTGSRTPAAYSSKVYADVEAKAKLKFNQVCEFRVTSLVLVPAYPRLFTRCHSQTARHSNCAVFLLMLCASVHAVM